MKILRLLQEISGLAEITHRRPQGRQPGLNLIAMRAKTAHAGPRRKHIIAVHHSEIPEFPDPVKITHVPVPGTELVVRAAAQQNS